MTRPVVADLAEWCQVLHVPHVADAAARLARRAGTEGWTYEEFLAACLEREVSARRSSGRETRIRAARFPVRKTLEEYEVDHRSRNGQVIAHLGTLDFVEATQNLVFLGPPGSGKTHLAIGISTRACEAGYRVAFATAAEWVDRLALANSHGQLHHELRRLGDYRLLVIDEVGCSPLQAEAAGVLSHLVSTCYERASLIVTSNKGLSRWPELFGDATIATGIMDRLLHHAEVVSLERSWLGDHAAGGLHHDDNPLAPEPAIDLGPPEGTWGGASLRGYEQGRASRAEATSSRTP